MAKEPLPNAIVLYDTEKGASYEQVSDLLINGKIEMRICTAGQQIDKSTYGKLPKITLTGATSLERTTDGVLILTKDSGPSCVVPINVKFDRDASYTVSELAEKAILQGRAASGQNLPPLKPGVRLVFVAALDTELAEYLKAERNGMPGWFDYAICDEIHQLAGDTAQGNALGTLASCTDRIVGLTGTLLGGYADDLFNTLFRLEGARMKEHEYEWGTTG